MNRFATVFVLALSACTTTSQVPPAARSELAPAGKLRVGVSGKSAYDLYLTRNLQRAKLFRAPTVDASYELFVNDKLEVLAGLKPRLVTDAEKLPGSRVLEGRFSAVQQSIGTPQGRAAGAKYLREFAQDAKASGFVAKAIERHAVRRGSVAPPAPAS